VSAALCVETGRASSLFDARLCLAEYARRRNGRRVAELDAFGNLAADYPYSETWTPAADEGCHRRRAVEVERAWLRTCQERSVLGCVRLADTGGLAVVQ